MTKHGLLAERFMTESPASRLAQAELTREEIYRDWLGIKNPAPSYYGLLGLPELESSATAILHAGRHVKRKLRAYQIGVYRKQALDLLAEIGQAVSVLTNPEKKRAYDADLVKRWRKVVEELYKVHCEDARHDIDALEAWLTTCRMRGVPIARLMPYMMRSLHGRVRDWPPHGAHHVGLPINLWIYRDAVVLGQCLHVGSLEKRAEAVKSVQKILGIPEGIARLVAEEVCRGLHLFATSRLVAVAKKDPEAILVRLGRRIHRFNGHVGRHAKVLAAVATIVGKGKKDLEHAIKRMQEPPVELTPIQAAALAKRRAEQRMREARQRLREFAQEIAGWVLDRPQILVAVAFLAGIAALVAAFLVAAGLWQPFAEVPLTDEGAAPAAVAPQTPASPASPSPAAVGAKPARPEPPPDWVESLKRRFGSRRVRVESSEVPHDQPTKTAGPEKPTSKIEFFGVRGDKVPPAENPSSSAPGSGQPPATAPALRAEPSPPVPPPVSGQPPSPGTPG